MFEEGAAVLKKNVKKVDALNVFPVPDGDTGTNMNLTIQSGIKEVKTNASNHAGEVAKSFSKGLLMGARGNSGVILSQLFRGFSKAVENKAELTTKDLERALEEGVTTAYKAVMKPVEGTILTVAKDASSSKETKANITPMDWMKSVVEKASSSLKETPELLPVLKEVGVVDSGGQGLVYIYEGMLHALEGKTSKDDAESAAPSLDELVKVEHHQNAQSHLATEDIEFGYCTEVMVKFEEDKLLENRFDENAFRNELARSGDSLLVVSDEDLLKIHIHAEYPGDILSKAQNYGSLVHVKIENMREQHQALTSNKTDKEQEGTKGTSQINTEEEKSDEPVSAPYGFVTVSMGAGIETLFRGLGVNEIIAGGQTMNPSTEDIVTAIRKVNADHIFVLPNNGNIVLAAEQAAEVVGSHVEVIPTKSVPQGLSALIAFNEEEDASENKQAMECARKEVKTGQVTYAVRDTVIDGLEIKKGDYMAIAEKEIIASGSDVEKVTKNLLENMIEEESEIVTLIRGEDGSEKLEEKITVFIEKAYTDVEVEIHEGGQPLYSYIISVE
ncbi:DAK2 domain-containing protein [Alteribacillus bidgolensis]|nr:DAK2 domain-containing protein [Alteribacillus bidgolensis]